MPEWRPDATLRQAIDENIALSERTKHDHKSRSRNAFGSLLSATKGTPVFKARI